MHTPKDTVQAVFYRYVAIVIFIVSILMAILYWSGVVQQSPLTIIERICNLKIYLSPHESIIPALSDLIYSLANGISYFIAWPVSAFFINLSEKGKRMSNQVEVDLVLRFETPCCEKVISTSDLGFNSTLETGQHEVECPQCETEFTLSINEMY